MVSDGNSRPFILVSVDLGLVVALADFPPHNQSPFRKSSNRFGAVALFGRRAGLLPKLVGVLMVQCEEEASRYVPRVGVDDCGIKPVGDGGQIGVGSEPTFPAFLRQATFKGLQTRDLIKRRQLAGP